MSAGHTDRIERLVHALETAPESPARTAALELIQTVLRMHGEGLQRVLAILNERGEAGREVIRVMSDDELIASLLSLHDLHPDSLRTRVERAFIQLRGAAPGVGADLLGISDEGVVTVRLRDASKRTRGLIEDAVLAAAPDAAGIVFEGEIAGFVPLASLWANGRG
jgi:hypothetical protein